MPLPGLTFRSYRLNTTKFTCNPHLAKPAARHGLSLASSGHPLTGTPTAGSTFLAYIFTTPPPQRPEPLTTHSPPGPGGSTYATRFRACLQRHLPPHTLSLPLGVFTPLGIVVLGAPGDPLACLQSRPISARSPPPFEQFFNSSGYGSSFPVRYAFFDSLFRKPLGTNPTMHLFYNFVNRVPRIWVLRDHY